MGNCRQEKETMCCGVQVWPESLWIAYFTGLTMQLQFVIWWFTSHWSVRPSLCGPYSGQALFYLRTRKKMPNEAENSKIFIYSKAIKRIVLLVGKNAIQQPILRCSALSPCLWEPCQPTARCLAPSRLVWLLFFLLTPAEQICCWPCLWLMSMWQPPRELPREEQELLHLSWRVKLCGCKNFYLL